MISTDADADVRAVIAVDGDRRIAENAGNKLHPWMSKVSEGQLAPIH